MSFPSRNRFHRPDGWKSDGHNVRERGRHYSWCAYHGTWIPYADYLQELERAKAEVAERRGEPAPDTWDRGLRAHPQAIVHKIRRKLDGTWIGPR